MQVNKDEFKKLVERMDALQAKLAIYEKCEHAREREFRELERDVYRLKISQEGSSLQHPGPQQTAAYPSGRDSVHDTAGQAWLR